MLLKNSNVKRGGVTAQYWYGETDRMTGEANEAGLRLRFSLPSKGGGETDILVTIGSDDLRVLLQELATRIPTLADALAEATYTAVCQVMVKPTE
jgi:hypothetical protein